MTGPEHYLEAERLIADLNAYREAHKGAMFVATPLQLSEAQAHATLALAAATALRMSGDMGLPEPDWKAWMEAARTQPAPRRPE